MASDAPLAGPGDPLVPLPVDPLAPMASGLGAWLTGEGPESAHVLSTRVRLARNLRTAPFSYRAREDQLHLVLTSVTTAARETPLLAGGIALSVNDLPALDRQFLLERHLISRELAEAHRTRGVLISADESLSVMVNEEDHIRIQSLVAGFALEAAWRLADSLDDQLDGVLEYAFNDDLGYLTSCPTNVGTGLRVSVLVHLPALVLTKQISRLLPALGQLGLAVRGSYGEGSEVMGNFFQVSNQTTLGKTERESIDTLGKAVRQLLDHEATAREVLMRDARGVLEDKTWRAYGALAYARQMRSDELIGLLSFVRFGRAVGVSGLPDVRTLNEILVVAQPAHLQKRVGRTMDQPERDVERAAFVRARLRQASGDHTAAS